MTNSKYRYRMRAHGSTVDKDGCIVDPDGTVYGDYEALGRRADRLERESLANAAHDSVFERAEVEMSLEPTVEGGTLDVMADGFYDRWNRKNG